MKTKILLICITTFSLSSFVCGQYTIPNAGFENWTLDTSGNLNPEDYFMCSNTYHDFPDVLQTSGHSGVYAVKLAAGTNDGFLVGGDIQAYFDITGEPHYFSFWAKTSLDAFLSSGFVSVTLYDADELNVAHGEIDLTYSTDWQQFYFGLNYESASPPAYCYIWLWNAANLGTSSDYVIIDDIEFLDSSPVAIDDIDSYNGVQIYPSVISEKFIVSLPATLNSDNLDISLYTIGGSEVIIPSIEKFSPYKYNCNIKGLDAGIYICKILSAGRAFSKQICIIN